MLSVMAAHLLFFYLLFIKNVWCFHELLVTLHPENYKHHSLRLSGKMEYMSQEGYDELVAELQHMVNVELPAVRDAIAEARDKGDLSENFEYHAAKREQGKLLSRISFKQKVLENARVIDKSRLKSDTVGLLSKIKITNLANKCSMNYTIVNPHEADLHSGKISIKSPIAKALLSKKTGDEVMVKVPAGLLKFRLDSVEL